MRPAVVIAVPTATRSRGRRGRSGIGPCRTLRHPRSRWPSRPSYRRDADGAHALRPDQSATSVLAASQRSWSADAMTTGAVAVAVQRRVRVMMVKLLINVLQRPRARRTIRAAQAPASTAAAPWRPCLVRSYHRRRGRGDNGQRQPHEVRSGRGRLRLGVEGGEVEPRAPCRRRAWASSANRDG